ncbi:MAG: M42 family metallopeptidase [Candidatus Heimdallarchaeota archaeon]
MDIEIPFLEKLSNAFGPSGHEIEVSRIIKEYVSTFSDEVFKDKTGSLIFKIGSIGPKIMLAGHIDEIGMMVTGINDLGYLTFHQIGGWWDQSLLTQRVLVRNRNGKTYRGIITAPPPHVLDPEVRKKVLTKDKMFIDVGCKSKKEIENLGIQIGDPITPDSKFELLERIQIEKDDNGKEKERKATLAVGKAFDDRIGAFIAAEVIRSIKEGNISHPNQIFGVATVQEEIGLRGARTAAQTINPDIGIALEVDISSDVPGVEKLKAPAEMSKGVSILAGDATMIPNPRFRHFVIDVAKEIGIDYQASVVMGGGTDAGVIHITGSGCPSIVLGVPTRHIHSHNGILDLADVNKAIILIIEILKRLDQETVDKFTEI